MLKLHLGSKFGARALDGVYFETLDNGIFRVVVTDDDGILSIIDSRLVTSDESKLL